MDRRLLRPSNPAEVTVTPLDPTKPERINVRAFLMNNNVPVGVPSDIVDSVPIGAQQKLAVLDNSTVKVWRGLVWNTSPAFLLNENDSKSILVPEFVGRSNA